MLFNSFQFLSFYLICFPTILLLRGTLRKLFLLFASYYFYMCWSPKYITVILAITLIDFVSGRVMDAANQERTRRFCLIISLICNVGLLVAFKYLRFFAASFVGAFQFFGTHRDPILWKIILPVGLSFHTFQAMSYVIDVYRRKVKAEKSYLNYSLYVAYFPQMVAGPIERPNQLLPQFRSTPPIRVDRIRSGAVQALWGFFKKMVIADGLSGLANIVYAQPRAYHGPELAIATLAFSLQIYCDFSGYTDIALGTSRMLGYELRQNFAQPYFSRSISEFWHRWHISLSTWFRDYVYIPLGGNRVSRSRHFSNIMLTFLLSGLWHGANWTFVFWGGLHGGYLILSQVLAPWRERFKKALGMDRFPHLFAISQTLFIFMLTCAGWIFFRASSLRDAVYVITHAIYPGTFRMELISAAGLTLSTLPFLLLAVVSMFIVEWFVMHPHRAPHCWSRLSLRLIAYQVCVFYIIFFGVFGHVDFIYFQF